MKLNVPSTLPLQWMSSSGCSMNPPGTINPPCDQPENMLRAPDLHFPNDSLDLIADKKKPLRDPETVFHRAIFIWGTSSSDQRTGPVMEAHDHQWSESRERISAFLRMSNSPKDCATCAADPRVTGTTGRKPVISQVITNRLHSEGRDRSRCNSRATERQVRQAETRQCGREFQNKTPFLNDSS